MTVLGANMESAVKLRWSPEEFGAASFGQDLEAAVRALQKESMLPVTGVVDGQTLKTLHRKAWIDERMGDVSSRSGILDADASSEHERAVRVEEVSAWRGATVLSATDSSWLDLESALRAGGVGGIAATGCYQAEVAAMEVGSRVHEVLPLWRPRPTSPGVGEAASVLFWLQLQSLTSATARAGTSYAATRGVPVAAVYWIPKRATDEQMRPFYEPLAAFDAVFPVLPPRRARKAPEQYVEREAGRLVRLGIQAHRIYPAYSAVGEFDLGDFLRFRDEVERLGAWGWAIDKVPAGAGGGTLFGPRIVETARHVG